MTPTDIHALRSALRLTQVELGRRVGVHGVTVCRWETGATAPSPMAARRLRQLQRLVAQKAAAEEALG